MIAGVTERERERDLGSFDVNDGSAPLLIQAFDGIIASIVVLNLDK